MRTHLHTNLKRLRVLRGHSADLVANAIGTTRSTLSSWENGASEPSAAYLLKLGEYYRTSLDLLLGKDLLLMPTSTIEELQRSY